MLNILLVDDKFIFRNTFKKILLSRFHAVNISEAIDGKEALERIKSQRPDLIFMDVKLPGFNGFHLTRKIKASYPEITVVIITTNDSPEYREAAHSSGADLFIPKKLSIDKGVLKIVESILCNSIIRYDEK